MLPFLSKVRKQVTVIDNRTSDGTRESSHDEDMPHPELHSAAEDFLSAVNSKDSIALAKAIERAHNHLSGEPDASDEEPK
jgi:hypothetical protein